MGNAYRLKSDLTTALENYLIASKIAVDQGLIFEQASIKIAIADAYSIMGDSKNAVSYYRRSIDLLKQRLLSATADEDDSINFASAQLNLGDEYFNQQKLDSALYYFNESGKLFKTAKSSVNPVLSMA
ncbi:tetratricopeptide repeat protein [uncultured Kiloniella sp.]|uniref:tetratricopeptide repeat protein n=1 Tax=uncultured Kiloniella sp. TaxID=1133091 RepID=UPI00261537DE|nr:tetratricopeptide repeat protein [uncultured Kiloniella sp.]